MIGSPRWTVKPQHLQLSCSSPRWTVELHISRLAEDDAVTTHSGVIVKGRHRMTVSLITTLISLVFTAHGIVPHLYTYVVDPRWVAP